MNVTVVKAFKKCINDAIIKINSSIKRRSDARLNFKDIVYYLTYINGTGESYDMANSQLKIRNILHVSKNTLIKRKNETSYEHFLTLNNMLLDHIYIDSNKRIIAIDGTHIDLVKSLSDDGFKISTNGNYCTALISTLFDVERKIPINYGLYETKNEREALVDQLKYLKANDILLMDRGYYSEKLLFTLHNHGIKVVFRLRKNLTPIQNNRRKTDFIEDFTHNNQTIPLRIIKYSINNNDYYLGTTIYNKDVDYFANLYWQRWGIEIHFRQSKYNLSLKQLQSKTNNGIRQDILIHNFIFIISSYFKYLLEMDMDEKYRLSTKNILKVTIDSLLCLFLYKTSTSKTVNEILRIMDILKQSLVERKKNREYPRIAVRPKSKWGQWGNKFKMAYT
jgi:hypothetical protein